MTTAVVVVVVVVVVIAVVVVLSSEPQAANDRAIKYATCTPALHFSFPKQQRTFRDCRLLVGSVHFSLKCTCRNHIHVFAPYKY